MRSRLAGRGSFSGFKQRGRKGSGRRFALVDADALQIVVNGRKEPAIRPFKAWRQVLVAEVVYPGGGFAAGVLDIEGDSKIAANEKRDEHEKAFERKMERGNEGDHGALGRDRRSGIDCG